MQILVDQLKSEYDKLNSLLIEYENNYLNLYNAVHDALLVWNDGHAVLFERRVQQDKLKRQVFKDEMEDLLSIYKMIIDGYSQLGKRIEFNLKNKDKTLSRLNDYIRDLDKVINAYNQLDLNFCPAEAKYINKQKQIWQNNKKFAQNVKISLNKMFNYIEDIENKTRQMINNVNITLIKQKEIDKFVGDL